jgi:regulatory subunit for Cdc7p protein kinase
MVEEERWRAKWIKVFPTLVFHFEIGTEESGKGLKGRVLKMGAVSRSFPTELPVPLP